MKVIVTGANGFVGRELIYELLSRGDNVVAVTRSGRSGMSDVSNAKLDVLLSDPTQYLDGAQAVIHVAGRAHIRKVNSNDMETENKRIWESNVELTRKIAELTFQYSEARFVLLSSIGVYGRTFAQNNNISESSLCSPENTYASSKLEAEYLLQRLALAWGGDYTIVRAPLIYGANAPANFGLLERLSETPFPLPFGAANAPRATIGVRNLAAFLRTVAHHPMAAHQTFIISDNPLLNARQLIEMLRHRRGQSTRLFTVPDLVMRSSLNILRKGEVYNQIFQPFLVDTSYARQRLDWKSPYQPIDNLEPFLDRESQSTNPKSDTYPDKEKGVRYLNGIKRKAYVSIRRGFDIIAALLLIIALAPLITLIAIIIKLDSPGTALLVQLRAGKDHKPFKIYKFRTMRTDAPHLSTEEMQQSGLNPITRVGAVLRRTSMDEIPQLLNILKGEMSFIGPRPALMTQTVVLTLREQAGVHRLLPGITGYAQATGRDDLSDEEKVKRDFYYLENLGIQMDLKILRFTVQSVLKGTGNK